MANTKILSEQIADNVALAGSPTTTTQSASDNSTKVATTAYVTTAVANLVDSAPSSLNTLNELAAAMNDNASFFSTVLPLSGGTMTGALIGTTATFTTADNSSQLTLKSTDDDANAGPVFDMVRDSASPADSDVLGRIRFRADNDAGEETTMVYLQTYLHDASDGSEDGGLDLFARLAGSLTRRITINTSGEICFNEDSNDIDFRVESNDNTHMLFVDGGNNRVGVGTSSPDTLVELVGADPILTIRDSSTSSVSGIATIRLAESGASDSLDQYFDIRANAGKLEIVDNWNEGGGTGTRVTLDDAGRVGIGTSSPSQKLEVHGAVRFGTTVSDVADGGRPLIYASDGSGSHTGHALVIQARDGAGSEIDFVTGTTPTTRMHIDSSGDVGIGTGSPDAKLQVESSGTYVVTASGRSINGIDIQGTAGGSGAFAGGISFGVGGTGRAAIAGLQGGSDADLVGLAFFIHNSSTSSADASEAMRIDSSANVGIGGTPTAPLHVFGSGILGASSTNPIAFTGSGSQNAGIGSYNADTDFNLYAAGTANIKFRIGAAWTSAGVLTSTGTEAMRLLSSGNLLVGRTNVITFSTNSSDGIVLSPNRLDVSAASVARITQVRNSSGVFDRFYVGASVVGSITGTTTATAFNTSSDQRLKENISDAADAGSKVDAIKVRQFDWKIDGSHQDYGMVAQELQSVAPEAVTGDGDSDEMMAVDYSKLVPMLIKEIQSLRARVAQLETAAI